MTTVKKNKNKNKNKNAYEEIEGNNPEDRPLRQRPFFPSVPPRLVRALLLILVPTNIATLCLCVEYRSAKHFLEQDVRTLSDELTSCIAELTNTTAELTSCTAELTSCTAELTNTTAELTSCTAELNNTTAELTSCTAELNNTTAKLFQTTVGLVECCATGENQLGCSGLP